MIPNHRMTYPTNQKTRLFPAIFLLMAMIFSGCNMGMPKDGEWVTWYTEALKYAQKQIFLVFYFSKNAALSEAFASDVLASEEFKQYAAKRFVMVQFDFTNPSESTKQQSGSLMDKYSIKAYPTIVIVNPIKDGRAVAQLEYGHRNFATFMAELQAVPGPSGVKSPTPPSTASANPLQKVKSMLSGEEKKETSSASQPATKPSGPSKIVIEGYDSPVAPVSQPAASQIPPTPPRETPSTGTHAKTNSIPAGQGAIIIEGYDSSPQ